MSGYSAEIQNSDHFRTCKLALWAKSSASTSNRSYLVGSLLGASRMAMSWKPSSAVAWE